MRLTIPPPLQALLCAGGMWLIAVILPDLNFSIMLQQPLAILLCIIGIGIDLVSIGLFSRAKTTISPFKPDKTAALVISGIYNFSRNPMYLGLILILTGFAVWLGNYVCFSMVAVFFWYITRFQIIPEEQVLQEKFGQEYENYKMRVRRWI